MSSGLIPALEEFSRPGTGAYADALYLAFGPNDEERFLRIVSLNMTTVGFQEALNPEEDRENVTYVSFNEFCGRFSGWHVMRSPVPCTAARWAVFARAITDLYAWIRCVPERTARKEEWDE
ncbi:hypothetical protein C4552_04625 [Candidatus Parcubacteria bacterium]|nr:MAG: hypothetical protein C4552_04625 [Candidatus Parcubacteria bacterium]